VAAYVSSYWDEGDITFLWEIADDGSIARAVELTGPNLSPTAATKLDEVIQARDTGDISAVQAVERRFGVAPEKSIDDWSFPHSIISAEEFDRAWNEARGSL
jgi:hypothetical protein